MGNFPESKKTFVIPKELFLPVSVTVGALIFVGTSVWSLSVSMKDFQFAIEKRFDCLERTMEYSNMAFKAHVAQDWDRAQMERWAYLLEKSNRNLPLCVPDISLAKGESVK